MRRGRASRTSKRQRKPGKQNILLFSIARTHHGANAHVEKHLVKSMRGRQQDKTRRRMAFKDTGSGTSLVAAFMQSFLSSASRMGQKTAYKCGRQQNHGGLFWNGSSPYAARHISGFVEKMPHEEPGKTGRGTRRPGFFEPADASKP